MMIVRKSLTFSLCSYVKITKLFRKFSVHSKDVAEKYSDVVIIGGGVMGSSTAYWLKAKAKNNLSVTVIEKDLTYSKASTVLSVGGMRQQFSIPENIEMSLFGAKFFEKLSSIFGAGADVQFMPNGYLILASKTGAENLIKNFTLQKEMGATERVLLSSTELAKRFPWINVAGVELGCLGLRGEGWFDPWSLLNLFKDHAKIKGVNYIEGEVERFLLHPGSENESLKELEIRLKNGESRTIKFKNCVLAAGADSGKVAKLANIGTSESGVLSVPLPVERRKRYVYRFDCQDPHPPEINTPLVIDNSGAYFRRDGGCFIGGLSPKAEDEPSTDDLDVDFSFFDEKVWPLLAKRVPAFENIKVKSAWAGFYEYNYFDKNGVIGPHPFYKNLYFATGFSGHGIQQSPAVGMALSELILDGKFTTMDLSRFGFERLIKNEPLHEIGIF